jgi:hypothetical protein
MAVTCLRLSVVGLSPRRPVFDRRPLHMSFVVGKVTTEEVSFRVLRVFLCQYYSTSCHLNTTLTRRTNERHVWNHPTEQRSFWYHGTWNRKILHVLSVPWLRRLVADFSLRRPGFNPGPVHERFLVEKFDTGTGLSLSKLIPLCQYHSITLIVKLLLLARGAG